MSSYLCWYLLLHKYTYKWKIRCWPKTFDAFLLACLVLSCILSGSKSGLLVAIFVIFYFRSLHRRSSFYSEKTDRSLKRIQTLTLGIASGVVVLVLLVTGFAANFAESLGALLTRLVSAGDVYFMAYPGSNLHDLDGTHAFLALFGPTLAIFRIVDPSSLGTSLGFQIFHNVVQSTKDLGPNPRHNIFGLVYFGYFGSLIYSAILGLLVCFVRNVLLKYIRLGGISEVVYVFVALHAIDLNTDVQSLISGLDSLIIVAPLIFAVAYILDRGTAVTRGRVSEIDWAAPPG
jgi:oligosaccharide repeat unit polymerase